ncbi:MAG: leucine-rich repeat domain-containing protein, partial [Muribaculaceae bacterium]|nr:leucine-rich repeat domain-containing protein [Muribaculaceae bacterium]
SITQLRLDLFGNCKKLAHVTIPPAVTKIDRGVFYNCPSLKEITIPQNVVAIGEFAFFDCENLTDIYCMATVPPEIFSIHRNPERLTVHVPAQSVEAYKAAPHWNEMTIVALD